MFKEFKDFAMRGNVVDLAVAVIIGGAFGKIVTSFVNDIIMPPIGLLIGGVNFKNLSLTLKQSTTDETGEIVKAISLNYGNFFQTTIDFLIIAFAIFIMVKAINRAKKKEQEKPSTAPKPSKEEQLLTEIRDLLKNQQS